MFDNNTNYFTCEFCNKNSNIKSINRLNEKMKKFEFCKCVETYFNIKDSGITGFNFDGWFYTENDMENKLKAMAFYGNPYAILTLQNLFGIYRIIENGQIYFVKH